MKKISSLFRVPIAKKPARGFTLLLAVLTSSILIALGSAIFDIISKEIILSSSGRESQFAFYAADTGVECVLYWDRQEDAFSTTSMGTVTEVECAGQTAALDRDWQNADTPSETLVTTFAFLVGDTENEPCTSIRVTRRHYPVRTTVQAAGYNTCNTEDPVRLERAIRVTY